MAEKLHLMGQTREKHAGVTRQEGDIPAVLYGRGITSKSLKVKRKEFEKLFRQAGMTSLVSLRLDDKDDHNVLIREVQIHPLKSTVVHIDFYQVRMDEPIRAKVPLRYEGESAAVRDAGGILVRNMDEVELEALPKDLPRDIVVDVSVLDAFAKAIHISDLILPAGVEVFHEPGDVIALVQAPRSQEELDEELAEEVKEDVEAVEGVKPEEVPAEGEGVAVEIKEGEEPKAESAPEQK